jgi:hypothetical protein
LMFSIALNDHDETEIRFREMHGARICRKGDPRAILEVKSPHIPTWMHEARLRRYDREKAALAKKREERDG